MVGNFRYLGHEFTNAETFVRWNGPPLHLADDWLWSTWEHLGFPQYEKTSLKHEVQEGSVVVSKLRSRDASKFDF